MSDAVSSPGLTKKTKAGNGVDAFIPGFTGGLRDCYFIKPWWTARGPLYCYPWDLVY